MALGIWSLTSPLGFGIQRSKVASGRSPADVTRRLDRLIADLRRRVHEPAIEAPAGSQAASDVLLVAHGHILRAFAMRWVGKRLEDGPSLLLETGGVGTLR